MTRLERKLKGDPLFRPRYPDDIAKLRAAIPELVDATDLQIQEMYEEWSEWFWAAGWLRIDKGVAEEFKEWILGEAEAKDD